jgi:chromosome segregation ATPase
MYTSNSINFSPEINQDDTFLQMKTYIKSLEKKISTQQVEIDTLKNTNINLEKEKLKLTSSLALKDNSIKDSTSILDNLKLKNEQLENKISELEKQNAELNYSIAELTQKNKSLINAQIFNSNNQNSNLNSQINNLTEQLNEVSIIKSKLEFDNKTLINKLNEMQNEHENEVRMITKIKNSEILQQNKTIANLQNGLNSLNNTINNDSFPSSSNININNTNNQYSNMIMDEFNELEKRTKLISDENNDLKKLLNELQRKMEEYEQIILIKDKTIKSLQKKNKEFEEEINTKNDEMILNSEENLSQAKETQNSVDQLLLEREDLMRQNTDLRYAYEQLNNGIKEANELFIQKVKSFDELLNKYNKKIQEYQDKIKSLIENNNNLNEEISKLKREKEKLQKKNEYKEKYPSLKGNSNLPTSNTNIGTMLQSPNRINLNNDNPYHTYSPILSQNVNYENQTLNFVKSGKNDISDPYVDSQFKSLENFKKVLNKVDKNLNKDKIILGQE